MWFKFSLQNKLLIKVIDMQLDEFYKNNNNNIDKHNKLPLPRWNEINPHLYIIRWKICVLYFNLIWLNACTQLDCYLHLWSSSPIEITLVFSENEKLKDILRGINIIHTSLLNLHHHFLPIYIWVQCFEKTKFGVVDP